jgi:hypothetical protein
MKLLLLHCPLCTEPLAPDTPEAVIYDCPSCQTPVAITDTGLAVETVQFVTPAQSEAEKVTDWMPFWLFQGRIHIDKRETQRDRRAKTAEVEHLWSQPRRLFVPAWTVDMHNARDIGSALVQRQPVFVSVERPSGAQMRTATVTAEDALKMLEFIIITIEAQRDDWLRDIEFRMELGSPTLYAIPAEAQQGRWHLAAQIEAELGAADNGLVARFWPF